MSNITLPLLTAGSAIGTADLFATRQGVDTVDKKITGTQLQNFIVASGQYIIALGDVQSGTIDGGNP